METKRAQSLSQWLLDTLSRRAAEESLSDAAGLPGYGISILRLVSESSDDTTLHAASTTFKNHIRSRWLPDGDSGISPIADSEKEQIKNLIVFLINSPLPPSIQSQLNEALIFIGTKDFLKSWPTFLPRLISQLRSVASFSDYASVNANLATANSIFQKFRQNYMADDQLLDLQYCLDTFAGPFLEIFTKTASLIAANFSSTEVNPEIRSAVPANITLYMEKHQNDFERFVNGFAGTICTLLQDVSTSPRRDQLAAAAMKFLTTVSTRDHHHDLFSGEHVIKEFCLRIVIPNVFLRVEEEELFEMDYIEFIRRDMEPIGLDSRRRWACELLKGLAKNYKTQVMETP